MLKPPVILGLDPGFASLGYAAVTWTRAGLNVHSVGVIRTKKAGGKQSVLVCEDNFERAREIARGLREIFREHRVVAVCAEAMSFPRQSSVAAKMAMSWGVIADITVTESVPLVQPTPQRVKKLLCGKNSASKDEVAAAVLRRLAELAGERLAIRVEGLIEDLAKTEREHAVDALACVLASEDGEVLRMAKQLP